MLVVQVRLSVVQNEELRPVCVDTTVRHAKPTSSIVPQRRVELVLERAAENGVPALSRARRIPSLHHETRYVPVEERVLVVVAGTER